MTVTPVMTLEFVSYVFVLLCFIGTTHADNIPHQTNNKMELTGYVREFKGHSKHLSPQFFLNPQITRVPSTHLLTPTVVLIHADFFFIDIIYYKYA